MKKIITTLLSFLALGSIVVPAFSFAQTSTTTVADLQVRIQELLSQIATLRSQVQKVQEARQVVATTAQSINIQAKDIRALSLGLSGDDVKQLQQWLASDPSIYPEGLVTGYFGSLTEKAVKRFQKKHNLEQIGIVGPKTRSVFDMLFKTSTSTKIDDKSDDSSDNEQEDDDNDIRGNNDHKIILCHNGITISVDTHAKPAHLTHGDTIGVCQGGTSTTTPDTIAPIISSASVGAAVNSATVSWTTNEPSTSRVWYATSTDVTNANPRGTVSNNTLISSHSLSLTGLKSSTTYYFLLSSTDGSGNTATSTSNLYTFTTLPFTVTSVSATSTGVITWQTSVAADSSVYYATTSPVMSASGLMTATSGTDVTNHSLSLAGLATSTTYYYLVSSKDSYGNTATSSEYSFATP